MPQSNIHLIRRGERKKKKNMYKIYLPIEHNIEQRLTEKANKYAHFTTDCTGSKCNVRAFEIEPCNLTLLIVLYQYNPYNYIHIVLSAYVVII